MKNRARILLLTLVMTMVALIVGGITILTLYLSAREANKLFMSTFVNNQARLMESVAQLSTAKVNADGSPAQAVMDYIKQVNDTNPMFTESGEVLFAWRQKEQMNFVGAFRLEPSFSRVVSINDARFEPMLRALSGQRGVITMTDYRDKKVIAAYAPVEGLNIGIVVKIDVSELGNPFLKTAIAAAVTTFVMILLASIVFQRIGNPLVQRLEENESKYRTLFENANEGILVISDRIEECNDQVTRLLGFSKEEMIGRKIVDFTPERQAQGGRSSEVARSRFAEAIQGRPQYFVWQSRHKDGSVIDIDVMLKSVEMSNRKMILATFLDITDRRRAEMELRKAEKEISEAREHLAHVARLSTAGEMAAGIAHEINQPLAAINTYAQASKRMLLSGNVSPDALLEPLEKISTQAMRAGEVIRRLRSFVNKSDIGLETVDCNQLLCDVVKLAEVDAHKHDIPVELILEDHLPAVRIDSVQIQQVLLNLVRNALEAMEDTPPLQARVVVSTAISTNGWVLIRVSDKGHGLSDEALKKVFHPFFTTKVAGMGMGLSISQSIVTAHGGQLSVYNNSSGGATFMVTLPPAGKKTTADAETV